MKHLVQYKFYFIPPEAYRIAADFREAASKVADNARRMNSTNGILDGTWEGNSKNKFFESSLPQPQNIYSYSQWLNEQASIIERITVWEWREREEG